MENRAGRKYSKRSMGKTKREIEKNSGHKCAQEERKKEHPATMAHTGNNERNKKEEKIVEESKERAGKRTVPRRREKSEKANLEC